MDPGTRPKPGVEIEEDGRWLEGEVTAVTDDRILGRMLPPATGAFGCTIASYRRWCRWGQRKS